MTRTTKHPDFACVDETHYIHLEEIEPGHPCNSSIGPYDGDDFDEDDDRPRGWQCIGCHAWWPKMPDMEPEGLAALCHMRKREEPT